MKTVVLVLLLLRRPVAAREDVRLLSELPLSELLAQKRAVEGGGWGDGGGGGGGPVALALAGERGGEGMSLKGRHRAASKKTFYEEDYEEEKGELSKKKKQKHKMHDVLNSSIMALSYLAFGGYLLCMIASALREKRRRYAMAYPTAGPAMSNQFAQVLQHYMSHRPLRPLIRFPAVTVHQGGRKRRRRFAQRAAPRIGPPPHISVIDYVEILSPGSS